MKTFAVTSAGDPTNRSPAVLVLMATFNGALWLDEQLRTIRLQEGVSTTLLACDDGSADKTMAVLERARSSGQKIRIHASAERGGSSGRNFLRLIREASTGEFDYVALADQDDLWDADKLARAVSALALHGAGAYSAAVRVDLVDGSVRVLSQSRRHSAADYLFEGAGQGCTFVFTKAAFDILQHGVRSLGDAAADIHYHDWLLYASARTLNIPWHFDQQTCMSYRQHHSNDTGARGTLHAIRRRVNRIRDGWYAAQVSLVAMSCERLLPAAEMPRKVIALQRDHRLRARCRMALFVVRHGRRKWRDSAVLFAAALAGWLTTG